jgi:hypothetical protein
MHFELKEITVSSIYLRGAVLALVAVPIASQACATCGCSLSADAAMGYSATAGWRVNLEYDFIDQDQLRTRYAPISPAQVAALNPAGSTSDNPGPQEVEHGTINRYFTAGVTYSPNANWSFTTLIPYINRTHTTYGNVSPDGLTPENISQAHSVGLGDIKLIGAFQGILPTHNLGVQLGVKLPSGRYGGPGVGRDPVVFATGPNAGSALDTSLNPGTGSTDLIVGAYYYQAVSQNFDAFVNGQIQTPVAHDLDQPGSDFRPGSTENLSFGVRYERDPRWIPQMQVNVTHKVHDQGALADDTDTAGTVIYLSPGLTGSVTKRVHAFGFVQVPVFSYLQGYQVFPHWTGSVGLSYAF